MRGNNLLNRKEEMKAGDIVVSRMTEYQKWGTAIFIGTWRCGGFDWNEVQIIGKNGTEMHEYCLPLSEETWKLIGTTNNY